MAQDRSGTQAKVARAMQFQRDGDLAGAERIYRQVLANDPGHLAGLHLLSALLLETGRTAEAAIVLQRAVTRAPDQAVFFANLGEAYRRLDRPAEARASLLRAVALRPDLAEAHHTLGVVAAGEDQLDEALACFTRAATLKPGLADAHNEAGIVLKELGRVEEALAAFRRAIAARPDHRVAHSNLVFLSSWHPAADQASIAREAAGWSAQQLAAHLRHGDGSGTARPSARLAHDNDPDPERPLRVGFVSPDFREHCQALFAIPLLEHLDRRAVEIACYSFVARPDDVTRRIEGLASRFRTIAALDDAQAADAITADRIDVLVDLTMHMANNRLPLFARRPAPVQVAWLAYPGTTGLGAIDHRVTDVFLDPPGVDVTGWYTEESVRLPETFWCYDPLATEPKVNALPARHEARDGTVTFGCLNNFGKSNSAVFGLWARVLRAVPGSRILLLAPPGQARRRVQDAFATGGVDPTRVEFVGFQRRSDYLKTYHRIDLCLDTAPVNGHTTSLDAFWMGVPVVTLVGPTVLGRAGLCYAQNLGLPDLVATTPDEYVSIAAALAGDRPRLERLRAGLRARMEASPLMDGPRFARNFEVALRSMWRRWCDGHRNSPAPVAPQFTELMPSGVVERVAGRE
jgi:protein O-GlcNAc transferase